MAADESPIFWRAAPLPVTESPAAIAADSPIAWRAAPLPATRPTADASDDPAPGAPDGMAAPAAPPEWMSPGALGTRGSGVATDPKRDWLIFYGLFAVAIVADVIAACLVGR
jgi:hypothetical protein